MKKKKLPLWIQFIVRKQGIFINFSPGTPVGFFKNLFLK